MFSLQNTEEDDENPFCRCYLPCSDSGVWPELGVSVARRARGGLEGNGEAKGSFFMELLPPPLTAGRRGIFHLGQHRAKPLNSALLLHMFAGGPNFSSQNLPEQESRGANPGIEASLPLQGAPAQVWSLLFSRGTPGTTPALSQAHTLHVQLSSLSILPESH